MRKYLKKKNLFSYEKLIWEIFLKIDVPKKAGTTLFSLHFVGAIHDVFQFIFLLKFLNSNLNPLHWRKVSLSNWKWSCWRLTKKSASMWINVSAYNNLESNSMSSKLKTVLGTDKSPNVQALWKLIFTDFLSFTMTKRSFLLGIFLLTWTFENLTK
jgi:hypothetical protein